MSARRVLAASVALLPVAILGGIAVGHGDAAPPDGRGPVAAALDLAGGPALDARRAAAVADATGRCLADRGIVMAVPVDLPPPVPDAGLDPIAWAGRWGFGISTRAAEVGTTRVPDAGPRLDAAARSALFGDAGRPGCQERARIEVYGLRDRLLAPLRPALEALGARIDADPGSRAADVAWVGCAGTVLEPLAGVPRPVRVGDLDPVRTWFAAQPGTAALQALERRVAAGIARCDLARVDARRHAAWPHEEAFVATHRERLAGIAVSIRAAEAAYPPTDP